MTTRAKCAVCGSDNTVEILGGYTYCRECSTARSSGVFAPLPAADSENKELVFHDSKLRIFTDGLADIEAMTGGKRGRLLDVGCGHGYFMKLAAEKGWKPEGVEISESGRKFAEEKLGFKVFGKPLAELGLPAGTYDAVTLWGVLDVLPDPLAELKEIYRVLKPGGALFLRVNNLSYHLPGYRLGRTALFRRLGIAPGIFHRWGISKKTLEALFSRAGYEGLRVRNSRPTSGDPYGTGGKTGKAAVVLAKALYFAFAQALFFLTFRKTAVSSALLASARKPA